MENTTKKPIALWRKLILLIPLGIIAFCWLFYFIDMACAYQDIVSIRWDWRVFYVCGWTVLTGSAALILALIPTIFIRPLSGGAGVKLLRVMYRCLLFFASVAVILFQCVFCTVCFWGFGV